MAGMGLEGAYGAQGTYEGLRQWLQGQRQKVEQGQADVDRVRKQRLEDERLTTESADREREWARQQALDVRQQAIDTQHATEFGHKTEEWKRADAERATNLAQRDKLLADLDTLDDPSITPFRRNLARYEINTTGKSTLLDQLAKAKEARHVFAPNGQLVDPDAPENLGRIFAPQREPRQGPADNVIAVKAYENGKEVTKYMRQSQAEGHTFEGAPPKAAAVTGLQRKALGYFNRARDAIGYIEDLEPNIAKSSLLGQAQLASNVNLLQTPEQQLYRQNQRAFTEARLRRDSGATIKQEEYDNDAKTYFAQPGDSQRTINRKRQARRVLMSGWKYETGGAYEEFYGEPNVPERVTLKGPDGSTHDFALADSKEILRLMSLGAEVVE